MSITRISKKSSPVQVLLTGQWVDLGSRRRVPLNLGDASERVGAVDVHGAGAADAFTARTPEGERGVHFVLDLEQGIQNHGTAGIDVDRVLLELRLDRRVFRVLIAGSDGLGLGKMRRRGVRRETEQQESGWMASTHPAVNLELFDERRLCSCLDRLGKARDGRRREGAGLLSAGWAETRKAASETGIGTGRHHVQETKTPTPVSSAERVDGNIATKDTESVRKGRGTAGPGAWPHYLTSW